MTIDLGGILRRRKPEKRLQQLQLRPADELVDAETFLRSGGRSALVPDTTVYIDQAAGRLSRGARSLVESALMSHCVVCLGELAVGLGSYSPEAPGWTAARRHFETLFESIPANRILIPDHDTWIDAGMIAGMIARTQGFQADQRRACFNDALIYLTASKSGLPVLTANRSDFDLIQQATSRGQFIHYKAAAS